MWHVDVIEKAPPHPDHVRTERGVSQAGAEPVEKGGTALRFRTIQHRFRNIDHISPGIVFV